MQKEINCIFVQFNIQKSQCNKNIKKKSIASSYIQCKQKLQCNKVIYNAETESLYIQYKNIYYRKTTMQWNIQQSRIKSIASSYMQCI